MFDFSHGPKPQLPTLRERLGLSKFLKPTPKNPLSGALVVWWNTHINILLHTYPHTALLTILDVVRVLPISSMYQNFNLKFTSILSGLASVLPLMLPLFGIHFLKTFTHHPLLPVLKRSSKPISMQRHILLSSFSLMVFPWC